MILFVFVILIFTTQTDYVEFSSSINLSDYKLTLEPTSTKTLLFPTLGKTSFQMSLRHAKAWLGDGTVVAVLSSGPFCFTPFSVEELLKQVPSPTLKLFLLHAYSSVTLPPFTYFVFFGHSPACLKLGCDNSSLPCDLVFERLKVDSGLVLLESSRAIPLNSRSFVAEGSGFSEENLAGGLECRVGAFHLGCRLLFINSERRMRVQFDRPVRWTGAVWLKVIGSSWQVTQVGVVKPSQVFSGKAEEVGKNIAYAIGTIMLAFVTGWAWRKRRARLRKKGQLRDYYKKFGVVY